MIIGILTVELNIPGTFSLKQKRSVLNSIRTRVRQKFNVSIAETGDQSILNSSCISVVTVSNEQKHADEVLNKVRDFICTVKECSVEDLSVEFL